MAAIDGDPKTGWGEDDGDGISPFLALRFARADQDRAQRP